MPQNLKNFNINRALQRNTIQKNLAANLIRHEYIVTTSAKAKKAKPFIESFLTDAIKQAKDVQTLPAKEQFSKFRAINYLQPPDRVECGNKIINEIADRYPNRTTGFTRLIKLEPRLGEDKAKMSVIELVDSDYEIKFWYTAKVVARMELQNIAMDDITELNVKKLTEKRINGEERFRDAVETCKVEFFKYNKEVGEVEDEAIKENLKNFRANMEYHGGSLKGTLLVSKKHPTIPRELKSDPSVIPPSPFLTQKK